MTTATPLGRIASFTASATCFVKRSCTCKRREKVSAIRASLDRPSTSLLGIYPIEIYMSASFPHFPTAAMHSPWHRHDQDISSAPGHKAKNIPCRGKAPNDAHTN